MIRGLVFAMWIGWGICVLVAWEIDEVQAWQHSRYVSMNNR